MPLKDLLVHVSSEQESEPAVDAALTLADQHDAHLTGLGIRPPIDMPTYAMARLPDSVMEILEERERDRLKAAKGMFEAKVKQTGRENRSDWRTDSGIVDEVLGLHARYFDLVVSVQHNPDIEDQRFSTIAEDVLLSGGRPVLVVPHIGAPATVGRKVIVAWNASREAARAVADAMPVLDSADTAEIFIAGEQDIGDLPGADIATHLARHGTDVEVYRAVVDDTSVGDTLLNRVADIGADLIVMGGYGRSRFREFILGGVTRHVLQHMTVPVLLSH